MALTVGTQLGTHEITALLGKGGMGEVYRARDLKLKREVAIKVLPEEFSRDADRVSRFQREAEVLASLNHPNIAAIHDLAEANGSRYLVLELVEGETLADRIARGRIPAEEALAIAKQICEALEAAHERGIVHRDLKPANIKLTRDGKVKVLDFGLAKAIESTSAKAMTSNSPTLLSGTMGGVLIGTAAYMSPEQAAGKAVDKRADIWSFGVVLWEMLVGEQLFQGETVSHILASVLKDEPDLSLVPPNVRPLLRRCLEKDPRKRLRDIGEAQYLLDTPAPVVASPSGQVNNSWVKPTLAVLVLILAAIATVTGFGWWRAAQPVNHPMMRFSVDLGVGAVAGGRVTAVLSPDGTRMVFPIRTPSGTQLAMRVLDQPKANPISGTEGGGDPFFSPDGQWIGFFANGKLKKISVQGGAALTLCDAPNDRGAAWGGDGTIIFSSNGPSGLMRVPDTGGTPQNFTKPEDTAERNHRWPQFLPGGQSLLLTAQVSSVGGFDNANIDVLSLKSGQNKTVLRGGYFARYLPTSNGTGHLVYIHEGTMFAVPFDPGRLEIGGTPVPILGDVAANTTEAGGQFDFSPTGTLAYLSGRSTTNRFPIVWLDSAGQTKPLLSPGLYSAPRFSPDGKRIAYTAFGAKGTDVWIYDLERNTPLQLTFGAAYSREVVWTPDGKHVLYTSSTDDKGAKFALWWIRSDGSSAPQRLLGSKTLVPPQSFSPEGKRLAFYESDDKGSPHILTATLDTTDPDHPVMGKPEYFLMTPTRFDVDAAFSPDGHWMAYDSSESGDTTEVFVRPFPGPGGKWKISTDGGKFPIWARDGRQLFFLGNDGRIMVVDYTIKADAFIPGKPRPWSDKPIYRVAPTEPSFDLAPDGKHAAVFQRALAEANQTEESQHATVLLNFFDELRRIAPVSKK
jgi:serine/threonine-protein kinase